MLECELQQHRHQGLFFAANHQENSILREICVFVSLLCKGKMRRGQLGSKPSSMETELRAGTQENRGFKQATMFLQERIAGVLANMVYLKQHKHEIKCILFGLLKMLLLSLPHGQIFSGLPSSPKSLPHLFETDFDRHVVERKKMHAHGHTSRIP